MSILIFSRKNIQKKNKFYGLLIGAEIEFVSKFGPERVREGAECVLKCATNIVPQGGVQWYRGETEITFVRVKLVD